MSRNTIGYIGAYVALLDRDGGRDVGEICDSGGLEGRIPQVWKGGALGVGEEQRQDLVRVRCQEVMDFVEVVLHGSAVEQKLRSME